MKKPIKQFYEDVLTKLETPLILSYTSYNIEKPQEIGKKKKIIKKLVKEPSQVYQVQPIEPIQPKVQEYPQNKLSIYHAFVADKKKEIAAENPNLSKAEALALARKAYKELKTSQ